MYEWVGSLRIGGSIAGKIPQGHPRSPVRRRHQIRPANGLSPKVIGARCLRLFVMKTKSHAIDHLPRRTPGRDSRKDILGVALFRYLRRKTGERRCQHVSVRHGQHSNASDSTLDTSCQLSEHSPWSSQEGPAGRLYTSSGCFNTWKTSSSTMGSSYKGNRQTTRRLFRLLSLHCEDC